MTRDEFKTAAFLLEECWPSEFTENTEAAYFAMLNDFEIADLLRGLRALRGSRFRPSVGELVSVLSPAKADQPTFDEMYESLLGLRGILHSPRFDEKATGLHPLVLAFVQQQGLGRLRATHFEDPDDGHWRRKELLAAWERHVEVCEGRDLAALTSGSNGGGLHRLSSKALTERGAA